MRVTVIGEAGVGASHFSIRLRKDSTLLLISSPSPSAPWYLTRTDRRLRRAASLEHASRTALRHVSHFVATLRSASLIHGLHLSSQDARLILSGRTVWWGRRSIVLGQRSNIRLRPTAFARSGHRRIRLVAKVPARRATSFRLQLRTIDWKLRLAVFWRQIPLLKQNIVDAILLESY